jgi:hypothetical protein
VAALANSAGVSGGAFYVPLFYAASGFTLKAATGLSQARRRQGSGRRGRRRRRSTARDASCVCLFVCWKVCVHVSTRTHTHNTHKTHNTHAPLFPVTHPPRPPPSPARPAAQAAIAGGSLVTACFNLSMRHPWDPGRPLVDLDLALVLTPAMLLGVTVGARTL